MKKIILVAFLVFALLACGGGKKSITCEGQGRKIIFSTAKANGPVTKIEEISTGTLEEMGLSSAEEFESYKSFVVAIAAMMGEGFSIDMTLNGDVVTATASYDLTKMEQDMIDSVGYEISSLKDAQAAMEEYGMTCK
jgi:hypothetical protein